MRNVSNLLYTQGAMPCAARHCPLVFPCEQDAGDVLFVFLWNRSSDSGVLSVFAL